METLEQVKRSFTEDMYSWADESDHEVWELEEMKVSYIDDIENVSPEWEEENLIWEAWYVRWYEVALQEVITLIEKSNNKLVTKDTLEYLLKN